MSKALSRIGFFLWLLCAWPLNLGSRAPVSTECETSFCDVSLSVVMFVEFGGMKVLSLFSNDVNCGDRLATTSNIKSVITSYSSTCSTTFNLTSFEVYRSISVGKILARQSCFLWQHLQGARNVFRSVQIRSYQIIASPPELLSCRPILVAFLAWTTS